MYDHVLLVTCMAFTDRTVDTYIAIGGVWGER
jgi:hypothetical protein